MARSAARTGLRSAGLALAAVAAATATTTLAPADAAPAPTAAVSRTGAGAGAGIGAGWRADSGTVTPASTRTAHTVGTDVRIRRCSDAGDSLCSVVHTIAAKGSSVEVICWIEGSSVSGDSIWYQVNRYENGHTYQGKVAGYWLDTGHDPASGVTHCYS